MEVRAQARGSSHGNSSSLQKEKKLALVSALPASDPSGPTSYGNKITVKSRQYPLWGRHYGHCDLLQVRTIFSCWRVERDMLGFLKSAKFYVSSLLWVPNIFACPQVIQADKLWKVSEMWEENIFSCLNRHPWKLNVTHIPSCFPPDSRLGFYYSPITPQY